MSHPACRRSYRMCTPVRWVFLTTVLPPLLFGVVPGLAAAALVALAVVAALWGRSVRHALRPGSARESGLALVLDGLMVLFAAGLLLACLTVRQGTPASPDTLALAAGCALAALLHRMAHPRQH